MKEFEFEPAGKTRLGKWKPVRVPAPAAHTGTNIDIIKIINLKASVRAFALRAVAGKAGVAWPPDDFKKLRIVTGSRKSGDLIRPQRLSWQNDASAAELRSWASQLASPGERQGDAEVDRQDLQESERNPDDIRTCENAKPCFLSKLSASKLSNQFLYPPGKSPAPSRTVRGRGHETR